MYMWKGNQHVSTVLQPNDHIYMFLAEKWLNVFLDSILLCKNQLEILSTSRYIDQEAVLKAQYIGKFSPFISYFTTTSSQSSIFLKQSLSFVVCCVSIKRNIMGFDQLLRNSLLILTSDASKIERRYQRTNDEIAVLHLEWKLKSYV